MYDTMEVAPFQPNSHKLIGNITTNLERKMKQYIKLLGQLRNITINGYNDTKNPNISSVIHPCWRNFHHLTETDDLDKKLEDTNTNYNRGQIEILNFMKTASQDESTVAKHSIGENSNQSQDFEHNSIELKLLNEFERIPMDHDSFNIRRQYFLSSTDFVSDDLQCCNGHDDRLHLR